jgi:hypothetical protein
VVTFSSAEGSRQLGKTLVSSLEIVSYPANTNGERLRCIDLSHTAIASSPGSPKMLLREVYGFAQVQNTEAEPGCAFHQSNYAADNLIWNPYGSLTLGMEFLYGWRVNKDGSSGNALRVTFGAKYNFVKTESTG